MGDHSLGYIKSQFNGLRDLSGGDQLLECGQETGQAAAGHFLYCSQEVWVAAVQTIVGVHVSYVVQVFLLAGRRKEG